MAKYGIREALRYKQACSKKGSCAISPYQCLLENATA